MSRVNVSREDASPFRHRAEQPLLKRAFPVIEQVPGYPHRSLSRDLIAGITVAALAIPAAMAYAEIAGLDPIHGLYALLLPAVAYMVFGSSRQVIIGPEGALVVLVAAAVAPLTDDPGQYAAAAAMLAVLVAAASAVARLLRLGWVADYFSRPVLVGYIHGIAVVLIVGQVGKIFGLSIEADDPLPQIGEILDELDDVNGFTVLIGLVSLAVLLALRRLVRKVPAALVVVVGGIGLIEPKLWRGIARAGRSQVVVATVAAVGVVVLGVLPALVLAVLLSIIETVTRSAQPHDAVLGWVDRLGRYADVSVHPSARTAPGVVIYRLDDRLFFANARYVKARVAEAIAGADTPARHLVFDAEAIADIDATGVQALEELSRSLRHQGIGLGVARLKQPMHEVFDATGLTATIGSENFHPTVRAAVDAYAAAPDAGS